jgi:protein tyrosine phosphatase (PTP) superfamily phosphohydrolase (DUF442 family)
MKFCLTASLLLLFVSVSIAEEKKDEGKKDSGKKDAKPRLKADKLGSTRNVHSFGKNLLCGQPTADDFAELKKRGIKVVITLRKKGEVNWDEPGVLKELGLKFHRFGFQAPDSLKDEIFDKSRKLLNDSKKNPVMLHCGSANRVGAIWAAHRVLDHGVSLEDALQEAKVVGLRTPGYRDKAVDYIKRAKAKASKEKK